MKLNDVPRAGRIACFGEILLRLSSPGGELMLQSPVLHTCFGGAEANVGLSLARFGHRVALASTLPDNALGVAARNALRASGADTSAIGFGSGRMGLYFLTPSAVLRQSEILYDRIGSAFALAHPARYDWLALLRDMDWLHVSGISLAVSERSAEAVLAAVHAASALGVRVSFDGNYRASLWEQQGRDGAAELRELMSHVALAFVDQRDIALILGRPELAPAEQRDSAAQAALKAFPRLERIAATVRRQHGVSRHELAATLHTRSGAIQTPPLTLDGIVDRIGTGDAFAAGVLHGVCKGWRDADTLDFGLAAAAIKHGNAGDVNLCSEQQVLAVCEGALDVLR